MADSLWVGILLSAIAARAESVVVPFVDVCTDTTLSAPEYVVSQSIFIGGDGCANPNATPTLTITQGVVLRFAPGTYLDVSRGTLKILGTDAEPVLLTSNKTAPTRGDWGGIQFRPDAIDATLNGDTYVSGSTLQHCTVEYAGGGPVNADRSVPYLDHVTLRSCAAGISLAGTPGEPLANPRLVNPRVEDSQNGGLAGISVSHWTGTLTIHQPRLEQNFLNMGIYLWNPNIQGHHASIVEPTLKAQLASHAISAQADSVSITGGEITGANLGIYLSGNGTVSDMRIHDNANVGIATGSGAPTITRNTIVNNAGGGIQVGGNGTITANCIAGGGVGITANSAGTFANNTIVATGTPAVQVSEYASLSELRFNNLLRTDTGAIFDNRRPNGQGDINARDNWWGAGFDPTIHILHSSTTPVSRSRVYFEPKATTPIPAAPLPEQCGLGIWVTTTTTSTTTSTTTTTKTTTTTQSTTSTTTTTTTLLGGSTTTITVTTTSTSAEASSSTTTVSTSPPTTSPNQTGSCGNAVVEDGEQCDGGGCCTNDCRLRSQGQLCGGTAPSCREPSTCDGVSPICRDFGYVGNGVTCVPDEAACSDGRCQDGICTPRTADPVCEVTAPKSQSGSRSVLVKCRTRERSGCTAILTAATPQSAARRRGTTTDLISDANVKTSTRKVGSKGFRTIVRLKLNDWGRSLLKQGDLPSTAVVTIPEREGKQENLSILLLRKLRRR